MEDCIFCTIVAGKMDAAKVYEDKDVLAFLDIYPESRGHVLVIPKQHAENIFEIPESDLQNIAIVGKKLATRLQKALGADGILLKQANGKEAGQVIFHFHLHVIPKYAQEGEVEKPTLEELKNLAKKLNSQ